MLLLLYTTNQSLTNENSETFNFAIKDGVRGFFTNPSRADDSFIPFKSIDNAEYTFDLWAYTVSVNNFSTTKIELPCKDFTLLSRTKLEAHSSIATDATSTLIGYKDDGTSVKLSEDMTDLSNVNISDYVRLEASVIAAYHHGNFKFKLTLS